MSKRFGRNQKQKMRQQIEQAKKLASVSARYYKEVSMLAETNRQIVSDTAKVLGKHFITMDPQDIAIRKLDALMPFWRTDIMSEASPAVFLSIALPVLRGTVVAEKLQQMTHIRFTYGNHQVGYSITEQALMAMPEDEAVRCIAHNMAQYLYNAIKKSNQE